MTTLAARPAPRNPKLRAWLAYAVTAVVLSVALAGVVTLVSPESAGAVWFAAATACVLQWVAFAAMVVTRQQAHLFVASWVMGMALRFGALGGVAWWLSRSAALPRTAVLLSLAGFVFLLVLLEPIFLRWDLRKS